MKRRKGPDVISKTNTTEYSVIEICEENVNDEDDLSKVNPFVLVRSLYSFFADKLVSSESNLPFDPLNQKFFTRKYLAVSVLRI